MAVLIIEDHSLLAESLSASLRAEGVEAAIATGPTADDVLVAAERLGAGLVLLDLDLGAVLGDGVDLLPALRALGATVVVLTGSNDRLRHAAAVEAGAAGVLAKSLSFDALLAAVRRALAGQPLLDDPARQELLAELRRHRAGDHERLAAFERLTRRERQVLAALVDGRSADDIASDWVVSLATVRSQIRSVLAKLSVNSQLSAVALARRAGWDAEAAR